MQKMTIVERMHNKKYNPADLPEDERAEPDSLQSQMTPDIMGMATVSRAWPETWPCIAAQRKCLLGAWVRNRYWLVGFIAWCGHRVDGLLTCHGKHSSRLCGGP